MECGSLLPLSTRRCRSRGCGFSSAAPTSFESRLRAVASHRTPKRRQPCPAPRPARSSAGRNPGAFRTALAQGIAPSTVARPSARFQGDGANAKGKGERGRPPRGGAQRGGGGAPRRGARGRPAPPIPAAGAPGAPPRAGGGGTPTLPSSPNCRRSTLLKMGVSPKPLTGPPRPRAGARRGRRCAASRSPRGFARRKSSAPAPPPRPRQARRPGRSSAFPPARPTA